MKHSLFLKLATVALLTVVAATGCKKTPKNVTPIYGATTKVAPPIGDPGDPLTPPPLTTPRGNPSLEPGGGLPPLTPIRPVDPNSTSFNPPLNPNNNLFPPANTEGGFKASGLDEFEGMLMDRGAFSSSTVHFEYDRSIVKSTELGKLQTVARALKAAPNDKLLIEGHCDERGTEEYNRALGERRALAVRAQLIKMGVAPARIRTLSYGEDKPAELGHTEATWARNRRGELVLLKPKI